MAEDFDPLVGLSKVGFPAGSRVPSTAFSVAGTIGLLSRSFVDSAPIDGAMATSPNQRPKISARENEPAPELDVFDESGFLKSRFMSLNRKKLN